MASCQIRSSRVQRDIEGGIPLIHTNYYGLTTRLQGPTFTFNYPKMSEPTNSNHKEATLKPSKCLPQTDEEPESPQVPQIPSPSGPGKKPRSQNLNKVKCHHCHNVGHMARSCPSNKNRKQNSSDLVNKSMADGEAKVHAELDAKKAAIDESIDKLENLRIKAAEEKAKQEKMSHRLVQRFLDTSPQSLTSEWTYSKTSAPIIVQKNHEVLMYYKSMMHYTTEFVVFFFGIFCWVASTFYFEPTTHYTILVFFMAAPMWSARKKIHLYNWLHENIRASHAVLYNEASWEKYAHKYREIEHDGLYAEMDDLILSWWFGPMMLSLLIYYSNLVCWYILKIFTLTWWDGDKPVAPVEIPRLPPLRDYERYTIDLIPRLLDDEELDVRHDALKSGPLTHGTAGLVEFNFKKEYQYGTQDPIEKDVMMVSLVLLMQLLDPTINNPLESVETIKFRISRRIQQCSGINIPASIDANRQIILNTADVAYFYVEQNRSRLSERGVSGLF